MINAADSRRITLLCARPGRVWSSPRGSSRIVTAGTFAILQQAIILAVETNLDLERVVIDGAASSTEFLLLIATMPVEVNADVLLISEGGGGFLSSRGRGGDRVLYSLTPMDIQFYLEAQHLICGAAWSAVSGSARELTRH